MKSNVQTAKGTIRYRDVQERCGLKNVRHCRSAYAQNPPTLRMVPKHARFFFVVNNHKLIENRKSREPK